MVSGSEEGFHWGGLAGEGIRFCILRAMAVGEGEIESPQEQRPRGLARVKPLN